jgi:predicted nucleotidyltransferase
MNNGIERVAREIVSYLKLLRIDYAIVEGFAVRVHALPRPTWDLDVVVDLTPERLPVLIQKAEDGGYDIDDAVKTGWRDKVRGMPTIKFRMFEPDGKVDVDIFLAESSYLQSVIKRRQLMNAEGMEAYFLSVEDLLLMKLMANRKKDQADVDDILLVRGRLDVAYLRNWAAELDVMELLEDAFKTQQRLT